MAFAPGTHNKRSGSSVADASAAPKATEKRIRKPKPEVSGLPSAADLDRVAEENAAAEATTETVSGGYAEVQVERAGEEYVVE